MNKKKIFMLGASGFVGSAILKAFTTDPSLEIYAAEHKSAVTDYPGIKKINVSLSKAAKVIEDIKPDIVIHAARISGKNYRFLGRPIAAFFGQHANAKICQTILKYNIKLLYISGSLMYGSHPAKKITEDFPLNPVSYAIDYSKAEEPFLRNYKTGPVMICRPGWIFGPNSWFKSFFEDIINKKGYIPQYGDGSQFMSIIHRDDLGLLVKNYALQAPFSNIYNMISPIGLSHKEFIKQLAGQCQKEIKIIPKEQLLKKYGQVTCDALTCNIRMATNYPDIIDHFDFKYKTVDDLLEPV